MFNIKLALCKHFRPTRLMPNIRLKIDSNPKPTRDLT